MENNDKWFDSVPEQEQVVSSGDNSMRGDDYYSDTTSWSSSMFKMLEDNEKEFDRWFKKEIENTCDDVFAKGQYLHDYMARMIDKDYKSECEFLILENTDKRTKAYKDAIASVENIDKVYVISSTEKAMIESLADDFLRSDIFQETLSRAESYSVEVGYRRDYAGFPLKGKLDFEMITKNGKHVFDWKTSSSFSDFNQKAWYYKYHRQAAIYSHISCADTFTFVVFDMVTFKRWKLVKVDMEGKFFKTGLVRLEEGIELAKAYLKDGVDAKCFKVSNI